MWRLLPTQWRSAATMACLGLGLLPTYGRQGYPAVLALALLVPVVVRWPRIGSGGRLGRAGLAQAACLGAACAAQQLPGSSRRSCSPGSTRCGAVNWAPGRPR